MLRNTVNTEALMTAFHLNQDGTNGSRVHSPVQDKSMRMPYCNNFVITRQPATVSEFGAAEGAAVGGALLRVRPRRAHVPHGEDAETRRHGDPRVAAGGAVDGAVW